MSLAIFGISNSGLNLAVSLLILMFVVVWLALIVYTYLDAKRRISDPFLIACATIASFFPYIGTAVYAIVRPPEFLEDAQERELEIKAAELRVRQLTRPPARTASTRSRRTTCAAPTASAASRTPARAVASPSTRAGRSAPTARPRLPERARRPGRKEEKSDVARRPRERRRRPTAAKRRPAKAPGSLPQKSPRPLPERAGSRRLQRGATNHQTTSKEPPP